MLLLWSQPLLVALTSFQVCCMLLFWLFSWEVTEFLFRYILKWCTNNKKVLPLISLSPLPYMFILICTITPYCDLSSLLLQTALSCTLILLLLEFDFHNMILCTCVSLLQVLLHCFSCLFFNGSNYHNIVHYHTKLMALIKYYLIFFYKFLIGG